MVEMICKVECIWDEEAQVWVATSKDVPGLILESGSFDALVEKVKHAVPELIELDKEKPKVLDLLFQSSRKEEVAIYG